MLISRSITGWTVETTTSGVILFAKAKEANAGVAKMFSEHLAQKSYNAISAVGPGRKLGSNWVTKNFLGRLPGKGKQAKYGAVRSGGDVAETRFRLIESWENAAWIEAMPVTGRTHQIRVHLSEAGLPILGDRLYPGAVRPQGLPLVQAPRLMLHAVSLTFPHPIHQTEVVVQSPLPEDFLQCIRRLQKK